MTATCHATKTFEVERELLGAISKLRKTQDDVFDAIVPNEKSREDTPHQDGLVMIFCNNDKRRLDIKCSLQRLFKQSEKIRWPNFQMVEQHKYLYSAVRESMSRKLIGYTTFFLFYGVIPESNTDGSKVEWDINETVKYFSEVHRGALEDVPKIFVFETQNEECIPEKVAECSNGTIFIVSNSQAQEGTIPQIVEYGGINLTEMIENSDS